MSLPAVTGVLVTIVTSLLVAGQDPASGRGQGPGLGAATELGFGLFQQRCLGCHGNPAVEKAPPPAALREMSPERILDALSTGVMKTVGDSLTPVERRLVAESVAGRLLGTSATGDAASMPNQCPASGPAAATPAEQPSWNGWGANLANTRFQPARAAGVSAAQVPRLRLKWAFGFPNGTSSYGQPTIALQRVFVGTDTGYLYALGANTGCVHWSFQAKAGVRNAPTVASIVVGGRTRAAVFVGDVKANVYAVDALIGRADLDHSRREPLHGAGDRCPVAPRRTALRADLLVGGVLRAVARLPVLHVARRTRGARCRHGTRGVEDLRCRRAQAGAQERQGRRAVGAGWRLDLELADDRCRAPRRVYVGTGDATTYPAAKTSDAVVAFDLDTGRIAWSYQVHENDSFLVGCSGDGRTENCPRVQGPDWDIPASVVLRGRPGRRFLLVGTKPGDILALDPRSRRGPAMAHQRQRRRSPSTGRSRRVHLRAACCGALRQARTPPTSD